MPRRTLWGMADVDDLERLFKLVSDEEALMLTQANRSRLARARLNVGAIVARGEIGALAYEVVAKIAVEILEGTIPIRTAGQAKDVASIFHQIARLEAGKSTANIETLTREERVARVSELAAEAAERSEARLKLVSDG